MKNNNVELAVVIPVYNEEEIIEVTLQGWTGVLDHLGIAYELHVYNDGSSDKTLDRIQSFSRKHRKVFIHDKPNSGHGATILQGYREQVDKPWIFQVDSDNEMSPDSFPSLWAEREGYDLLIGRRDSSKRPFCRMVVSFVSRLVVWFFYGAGIWYVNSPYRLMRSTKFKQYFSLIPSTTVAPNIILSGIACLKRLKVCERKVAYTYRKHGHGSINIGKVFKMALKSFLQTAQFRFVCKV